MRLSLISRDSREPVILVGGHWLNEIDLNKRIRHPK